jgi:EmrB/QacA subfamily drug resistance transporter
MAHVQLDAGPTRRKVEPREGIDRHAVGRDSAEIASDRPHRRGRRNSPRELIVRTTDEFAGRRASNHARPTERSFMTLEGRSRWIALYVLCLATLMIVLDMTIVNVALPSIKADLGFSETSLAWVVNAYLLTYGGCLLLGGRLGDLLGHRRLFLIGIALFTLASLACGVATVKGFLVGARAVQGIGGAVASAVSLSLMMTLFVEPAERAKAMGIFGFVAAGGGSIGVVLGGVLTDFLNWHWIFLVNVPIGALVVFLSLRLLPGTPGTARGERIDLAGAATVTGALMLAIYAIVNGNHEGWTSGQTLGLLGGSAALLGAFLWVESHVRAPLVPLRLFRLRNFSTANVVGVLWAAAMFAWFFLAALYMQFVLGYSPLQIGLAFLPSSLIMAVFSIGLSAKLVMRYGISRPLATGLGLAAAGLALFIRLPVEGNFVVDVLPSMILLGFGAGMAFNPVLLAAMNDVDQSEAGLASGIVNTSFMMGGALGLAVLASVAASRTSSLKGTESHLAALTDGYHLAFLVGAIFAAVAATLGGLLLPNSAPAGAHEPESGQLATAQD